jgi:hypothetical protein
MLKVRVTTIGWVLQAMSKTDQIARPVVRLVPLTKSATIRDWSHRL